MIFETQILGGFGILMSNMSQVQTILSFQRLAYIAYVGGILFFDVQYVVRFSQYKQYEQHKLFSEMKE